MLSLTDDRTGRRAELVPARPGVLRVRVRLSRGEWFTLADLRACLLADVTARLTELAGPRTLVGYDDAGLSEQRVGALERETRRLGVRPPAAHVGGDGEGAGAVDVWIIADSAGPPDEEEGGVRLRCGPVSGPQPSGDRLRLRLALLDLPYGEPAALTADGLAAAGAELDGMRRRVAAWAREPSRPPHAPTVRRAFASLGDGLDTGGALAALRALAGEPGVPDGARFETYVYLDRVFALELPREIGY